MVNPKSTNDLKHAKETTYNVGAKVRLKVGCVAHRMPE